MVKEVQKTSLNRTSTKYNEEWGVTSSKDGSAEDYSDPTLNAHEPALPMNLSSGHDISDIDMFYENEGESHSSSHQIDRAIKNFAEEMNELYDFETSTMAKIHDTGSVFAEQAEYSIIEKDGIESYSCHVCLFEHTDLSTMIIHCSAHKEESYDDSANEALSYLENNIQSIGPSEFEVHHSAEMRSNIGDEVTRERLDEDTIRDEPSASLSSLAAHQSVNDEEIFYDCAFCEQSFSVFSELTLHTRRHTEETPYKCGICEQSFSTSGYVTIHSRISHTGGTPLKCLFCEREFISSSRLANHKLKHTSEKKYKCDKCDKRFYRSEKLERHMSKHTEDQSGVSAALDNSHSTTGEPTDNAETPTDEKTYKCTFCEREFNSSFRLANHTLKHTSEKKHKCDKCDKRFYRSEKLERHILKHTKGEPGMDIAPENSLFIPREATDNFETSTDEKTYKCTFCEREFNSSSRLANHTLKHTSEKKYKCDKCDKRFYRSEKLERHILKHTEDEPGMDTAPESFHSTTGAPTANVETSTDEKTYKCTFCEREFNSSSKLANHMLKHTSEKKYKCDKCDKRFYRSEKLEHHILKHTEREPDMSASLENSISTSGKPIADAEKSEKKHKCSTCGQSFVSSGELTAHTKTHAKEKRFKCPVCVERFISVSAVRRHQRIHSAELPYMCYTCGERFKTEEEQKRHMSKHAAVEQAITASLENSHSTSGEPVAVAKEPTGEGSHECSICGLSFLSSGELTAHTRVHLMKRPFICPVCNHSFETHSTWKLHKEMHPDKLPYVCDICGDRSKDYKRQIRHMIKYHEHDPAMYAASENSHPTSGEPVANVKKRFDEMPFKCSICRQSFPSAKKRTQHSWVHNRPKKFKCSMCGKAFASKRAWTLHELEKKCRTTANLVIQESKTS